MPDKAKPKQGVSYYDVEPDSADRRLDNYLMALLKGVPKSHIYRIIRSGEVRIDGGRAKPARRLRAGEQIRVPPMTVPRPSTPLNLCEQDRLYLESLMLYEDESLLILNKPSGFAVHSGSRCNFGLAEMLRQLRHSSVQPAHRLDRNTSGCLVFAKRRQSLLEVHSAFRNQQVKKTYLLLVKDNEDGGTKLPAAVKAPLLVSHRHRGASVVVDKANGQAAETYFEIAERLNGWLLLQAKPMSGRMHQIRVHSAYVGYPIAGDTRYGDFSANKNLDKYGLKRIFLHSARIEFECGGKSFDCVAPLPEELERVLNGIRAS